MDPVHVRGDDEPAQPPVQPAGQADVAVIEHGHAVQDHLEKDDRYHRRSQGQDDRELDQHGQDDLDGVKARPGGQVVVQVGMVDPVQPPQGGHGVEKDVLGPDRQVQGDHRQGDRQPGVEGELIEQAPALGGGRRRQPHGRDGEEQPQHQGIEHHQPQITGPASDLGNRQGPPGGAPLPQGHGGEDAKKGAETDGRLMGLDEAIHGRLPPIPGLGLGSQSGRSPVFIQPKS